ncbi:MAG: isoleucine--tRNA ligase, partial [Novosphingobium sp.]
LPQKEPQILARWQADGLYQRTREARAGREKFILHDGPPYANGDMHIGHALNHILKDMVVRTQTLLGKDAPYVPGWDCHGLPIEWKVEEQYRKKKLNKDDVPPEEFRAECRAYAQHWVDVQREQLKRLGIGGDWDNPYLTMDFEAEATIVSELLKFAESGQLYRGAKPVMWSPVEKTALAEAEVEYEDITSTQIDVAFEIVESPIPELVGAYAVVWTTTPWTIPANQAIAYGEDVEYVVYQLVVSVDARLSDDVFASPAVQQWQGKRVVIAASNILKAEFEERFRNFWPDGAACTLVERTRVRGSDLAGTFARHPIANLLRRPGLEPGQGFASGDAGEGSGTPDQVRGDDEGSGASSPLPGGEGMGVGVPTPGTAEHPHPTLPLKGEGLDPANPLAEFYLRPRPFLPGDFVTTDTGTGLVHLAPDHGEDDFALCKAHGIKPVFAVEADGRYRADRAWLGGNPLSVINPKLNAPEGPICSDLRAAGALLAASADYRHSYPHSWRSKAKVIYRCTPQWFVPMDKPIDRQAPLCAAEAEIRAGQNAGETLRETALAAIAATRFVPAKGRNRIGAMVEGRPDWVLSRQRAWGVPITLFVDRRSGQYLNDPEVNARIVAAVREGGVDAWSDANTPALLGERYDPADYERVADILDVWFDSGSTHAFVLESGRWPELLRPPGYKGPPADLYLEGSDQHRGWFQSSLLESCATRGRAPYKAVLTHGFTMDAKGLKMSKSLGNTVNPLKLMEQYGADILRLWALSVDYTEDHRIGEEILKGVADQYRKLRNTFRYLLGALDGFSDAERVGVEEMPELERYVLALLGRLDASLRRAVDDFDFNAYVRALVDFCNEDLSAFFFDIRKDSLYCDAPGDPKRRAYRTVLDTLFHALARYAAPVLVFTTEEVWGTRFPDAGSVHLLEWPELGAGSGSPDRSRGDEMMERWSNLRALRVQVFEAIEPLRRDKLLGSGLEAEVAVPATAPHADLAELFITASVTRSQGETVSVRRTDQQKCGRCWRHLPEVVDDGALCGRCTEVVGCLEVTP